MAAVRFLLVLMASLGMASAGFRCLFGNPGCTAGCVVLGQTSGVCDDDGECFCSEKSISLDNFKSLLPSRCNLGESFCEGTCNAIGRRGGKCEDKNGILDCVCDDKYLSATEFALCAAESTCRLDCQAKGSASGECDGWKCKCTGKGTKEENPTATPPSESEQSN